MGWEEGNLCMILLDSIILVLVYTHTPSLRQVLKLSTCCVAKENVACSWVLLCIVVLCVSAFHIGIIWNLTVRGLLILFIKGIIFFLWNSVDINKKNSKRKILHGTCISNCPLFSSGMIEMMNKKKGKLI